MVEPEEICRYWVDEVGPEGWYAQDEALDADIRARFLESWEAVAAGDLPRWGWNGRAVLARIILTDQFPRNMFRGDARSFATDGRAREWAKWAVQEGRDGRVEGPAKQFFYLPMMHSEVLADQDQAVRLFLSRLPGDNLRHARAHRQVIRDFGRFPYRNAALGRVSSPAEEAYLAAGGYRWSLQHVDDPHGASWHEVA
ncbi:DUF924 family protein [Vannielia litorea]|uniref:Uncharacterized conserved protein, DUF924 family n=1 Tax=Vannielia litorea TaxID=1217970 RepID=A0A1N6EQZ7_9RHOB|nr:DUF924 family protein [Vannielia litorea]SIN85519.1 Uncharacterized conserved protein, DUF924 family [Vannielia litorea]